MTANEVKYNFVKLQKNQRYLAKVFFTPFKQLFEEVVTWNHLLSDVFQV